MKKKFWIGIGALCLCVAVAAGSVYMTKKPLTEPYDYPVRPGDDAWADFTKTAQMYEACQIPEDVLDRMTTEALLETVLDHPLADNVHSWSSKTAWFDMFRLNFNGLDALMQREDLEAVIVRESGVPLLTGLDSLEGYHVSLEMLIRAELCGMLDGPGRGSELIDLADMYRQAVAFAALEEDLTEEAVEGMEPRFGSMTAGSFTAKNADELLVEFPYRNMSHAGGFDRTIVCIFDRESGRLLTGKIFAADEVNLYVLPAGKEQSCILALYYGAGQGLYSQYGDLYQIEGTKWNTLPLPEDLWEEDSRMDSGIDLPQNWTLGVQQDLSLLVIREDRSDPMRTDGGTRTHSLEVLYRWKEFEKTFVLDRDRWD